MLEYIIGFKSIFIANILGVVTGYLSSCFIEPVLFKEQNKTVGSGDKRAMSIFLWGVAIAFACSVIFIGFAALNYLLIFVPRDSFFYYARTLEYETIPSSFMLGFFCGMSSTLIRICESAFAAYKNNKT